VPLTLDDALVQPITKGSVNAPSAVTSLGSPTTAGKTLLIAATTYGTTGIATPTGYTPDQGTNVATAKVYLFRKSNCGAGETLPTLTTGASTQKTTWFALELDALDPIAPKDVVSAIATATAQSIGTAAVVGTSYDTIGFVLHLAQDATSTSPPTWSDYTGNWVAVAEQGQADATTAIGTCLSVFAPLQTNVLPGCSATASLAANGPLAAVAVKYAAAGSKAASDLRYFTGFEFGTLAGAATGVAGSRIFETISGSPFVTDQTPRSGNFCLELPNTAVAHNFTWPAVVITTGQGVKIPARVCVRFVGGLPTSDTELCLLEPSGVALNTVVRYRTATQKIGVQIGSGTEQLSAATVAADTWHEIDLDYDIGSGSAVHTVNWQFDRVDQAPVTHTSSIGATGVVLRPGRTQAAAPGVAIRLDDCLLAGSRGNYPIGDHKVVLVGPDPAGTLSVVGSGGTAVFNTFSANGAMAAWNAATALAAISEGPPPTIGASAAGIVQVTTDTITYVKIPMATYVAAANEVIRAVRVLVCGWAASATAATIGLWGYSGSESGFGAQLFAVGDPGFDNSATTPAWLCKLFAPTGGWNQAKLDAFEVRMGGSDDAAPDVGPNAVYAEVAVAVGKVVQLFGEPGGTLRVEADTDPLSGAMLALRAYTPAGQSATLRWYDDAGTPHGEPDNIPAGSNPHVLSVGAVDIPSAPRVELIPSG
jgi:hypothetical protein